MKQLHVYSNGQWIATGGVDLTGYARTTYVDSRVDPIQQVVAQLELEQQGLEGWKQTVEAGITGVDSGKADKNNPNQDIVASTVAANKFFLQPDKAIVSLLVGESERPVYRANSKNFPLAFTQELQGLAKITDLDQVLTTKSIIAQGFAFDQQNVIKIHDTGEGYGPRISYISEQSGSVVIDPFVFVSDLEPLNSLLPKITELEGKVASPVGAVDINDPALADFKSSVMNEVRTLMAGGKQVPPDIDWTVCPNSNNGVFAKCLNGVVHLRGVLLKSLGSGYTANAFQLPEKIPAPIREMVVPLAGKNSSSRVYSYATLQVNRQVGISGDAAMNNVWFDCISYPAYD